MLPFFAAKCEKEEAPDLPSCDYVFECKVNGQTWKPKGSWNNPELTINYSSDTIGNWIGGQMIIAAQHQVQTNYGDSRIVMYLDSLYSSESGRLSNLSYSLEDERSESIPREEARRLYYFDSVIKASIIIHEFVPDNYSKDWQRGYINMNFSATLINGVGETVEITDGKICQRFQ